ncbi:MAG: UDP-N-acetylglucosamine 2-epimerase [Candidatus Margulisiibacteriota bacterium]
MVRRKICIVTGSRADYGLLRPLIKEVSDDDHLSLQIIAAGMHLMSRHGFTYKQIIQDGFKIDAKVDVGLKTDTDIETAMAAGRGVTGFAGAFQRLKPDIVVVLGDRYEIMAAATAAMLMGIPIAHIHGGEVTVGAFDDAIRHAITKMAYLHFVSHKDYARRVIQMGEDPKRVFNYGAPGLDSIKALKLLSKDELEKYLDFKLDKNTALVTYHPVTMEKGSTKEQINNLLLALDKSDLRIVFTMPNADPENDIIFKKIETFVQKNPDKSRCYTSLGQLRYLSLMQYAGVMIGNSSSGIIEAPSFQLPVVNIGSRQKGRIRAENVIDTPADPSAIARAIKKALSPVFQKNIKTLKNPFGNGTASVRIKDELKGIDLSNLQKGFYDLK